MRTTLFLFLSLVFSGATMAQETALEHGHEATFNESVALFDEGLLCSLRRLRRAHPVYRFVVAPKF